MGEQDVKPIADVELDPEVAQSLLYQMNNVNGIQINIMNNFEVVTEEQYLEEDNNSETQLVAHENVENTAEDSADTGYTLGEGYFGCIVNTGHAENTENNAECNAENNGENEIEQTYETVAAEPEYISQFGGDIIESVEWFDYAIENWPNVNLNNNNLSNNTGHIIFDWDEWIEFEESSDDTEESEESEETDDETDDVDTGYIGDAYYTDYTDDSDMDMDSYEYDTKPIQ